MAGLSAIQMDHGRGVSSSIESARRRARAAATNAIRVPSGDHRGIASFEVDGAIQRMAPESAL